MRNNTSILSESLENKFGISAGQADYYQMSGTSPDYDNCNVSLHFGDSGYLTHNMETQSSCTNSEPSLDEVSTNQNIYFCENTVFDEPKLEGPPLLCDSMSQFGDYNHLETGKLFTHGFNLDNVYDTKLPIYSDSYPEYSHLIALPAENEHISRDSLPNLYDDSEVKNFMINDASSNIFKFSYDSILPKYDDSYDLNYKCDSNKLEAIFNNKSEQSVTLTVDTMDDDMDVIIEDSEGETTPSQPSEFSLNISQPSRDFEVSTSFGTEPPSLNSSLQTSVDDLAKNDRTLLRRVQETLKGIPPPPSVTIMQITVAEMLTKINNNKHLFLTPNCQTKSDATSLLITHKVDEVKMLEFSNALNYRCHGLHYNHTKVSEEFERHCLKYGTTYVGAETASSCTVWSTATTTASATKRRNARMRWGVKSPGRRLSHLAKRRITFSSSNLQSGSMGGSLSVIGAGSSSSRVMIDTSRRLRRSPRKSPRKSPWKRSPTKAVRTPTSASKLRSALTDKPGTSRVSVTKRALFQSPERGHPAATKRALFTSPKKGSPMKQALKRKRVDDVECHPSKFPRSLSFDVQNSSASGGGGGVPLTRRHSEVVVGSGGREAHEEIRRKKLLWAVSEALRSQQIPFSHPQFRTFGKILCKVVQHQMPDILSNGPRQPGSTSERMLRMARQHVRCVVQGKTYDQIIRNIKDGVKKVNAKPSGYVALETKPSGHVASETKPSTIVTNVLQDKVLNIEQNVKRHASPMKNKSSDGGKARIRRQILFDDESHKDNLITSDNVDNRERKTFMNNR